MANDLDKEELCNLTSIDGYLASREDSHLAESIYPQQK
jgi:hypothetical protein